jgi:hypothetical protein
MNATEDALKAAYGWATQTILFTLTTPDSTKPKVPLERLEVYTNRARVLARHFCEQVEAELGNAATPATVMTGLVRKVLDWVVTNHKKAPLTEFL